MLKLLRRQFLHLIAAGTAALPAVSQIANAQQQRERMRRIGVLMPFPQSDLDAQRWLDAFKQGLQGAGWIERTNLSYDIRFSEGRPERLPGLASDLVGANLDVIVTWAAQPI